MQQSNSYIIIFSIILTVILGGLLSLASTGLGPMQEKAIKLDKQRQILGAVMEVGPEDDVIEIFDNSIHSLAVNYEGEEVQEDQEGNEIVPEDVNIAAQYKKDRENRVYPVFKYYEGGGEELTAYILPVYGVGLWDNIWGYVALDTDLNTVEGISLDHAGETPGLGARITENEVQGRYEGKKIYNDEGELVSIKMLKGENNPPDKLNEHTVDGLSGATITGKGVNSMLEKYLKAYQPYLEKLKSSGDQGEEGGNV